MTVGKVLTKVFGSRNERLIKRYTRIVERINELEPAVSKMTDEQLQKRTLELHDGLLDKKLSREEVMYESFAIIREAMDRNIGIRQIFNPEGDEMTAPFEIAKLDPDARKMYDDVVQRLISSGEHYLRVPVPVELYEAVRKIYPDSRPPFRARCFDVQLIGGVVLYEGKIAEMATGEGKTFVAPLACFLKVLEGNHCHVVTVNDYLVKRDASWVAPAFAALGISVGFIQSDMEAGGDVRRKQYECDITYGTNSEFGFDYLRDNMKERVDLQVQGPLDYAIVDEVDSILIDEARTPLIISGFARDDAPKYKAADEVARKVIALNAQWNEAEKAVDAAKRAIKAAEGDADKARTKDEKEGARKRREQGEEQLAAAEKRKEGLTQYYEVEWDRKSVHLTHEGIAAAQDFAGVGSFYVGNNMEWPHLMEQAMRAHVVYEKDKDYVIDRGRGNEQEIVIVDEYTGRKMVGRQWSDGLHQACEAKERVTIKQETQTLATITLQNFFKLYKALAGMTGTAQTEAEEFSKIYKLDVVSIPTNRPVIRLDHEDRVYRKEREKWDAIIEEIKAASEAGRPVLVGTTSVEKSEKLSAMLTRKYGIEHEVLNAKQHEREAHIVAKAGQQHVNAHGQKVGNVTVATNMAGRGTDIKPAQETFYDVLESPAGHGKHLSGKWLVEQRRTGRKVEVPAELDKDGNPDPMVDVLQLKPGVKVGGGLHVIATERHTARRIDNQLRGRSGRQGDPGSSRFYVSLEDELMSMFAGEWTIKVLGWLGMEEGMAIEDKRITKGIVRAQKKVEERNFMARKNLLDYDEVMDYQRGTFYGMRQQVLEGRDVDQIIWKMIGDSIRDAVVKYVGRDFVAATISEWTRNNFEVAIDPEELRGRRNVQDLEDFIKGQAKAEAETTITATLEEFMGEGDSDDPANWDTRGLSSWAMSRFQVNLPQSQIRKMDRRELEDKLRVAAIEQIEQRDVNGILKFLEPLYPQRELAAWAKEKFGVEVTPEEMLVPGGRDNESKSVEEISDLIEGRGRDSYAKREIEYPIDHVLALVFTGQDGEIVANPYAADYLRNWIKAKYGVEVPIEHIQQTPIRTLRDELLGHQEQFLKDGKLEAEVDAIVKSNNGDEEKIREAFKTRFGPLLRPEEWATRKQSMADASSSNGKSEDLRDRLFRRARQALRQELTDLEQFVLIQIFDQTWKDHLYAMDILRGGVGLAGFAEKDPRIVFKKEGYEYFQQMMQGIRDKVTDLIFRARVVGQAQARSAYRETAAIHEDTGGYGVAENRAATAGVEKGATLDETQHAMEDEGAKTAKVSTIVREAPKVGRNDPCPCGSGKKYKKCHGLNVA